MMKRIALGTKALGGLLLVSLSACTVNAEQTDPCRLVVDLSPGRPKNPNPPFLESALLNDAKGGKDYLAAETGWMHAQNQLAAAENKVFVSADRTRRLEAEARHSKTFATFLETSAFQEMYRQLLTVCGEIQDLRIQLLANDGGVAGEISLVQQDAKSMTERSILGPDALRALYNSETDLVLADATNPEAFRKRVAGRLEAAKAARDRLKAATAGKR